MQGMQVRFLVRELRSHMPLSLHNTTREAGAPQWRPSAAKIKKKKVWTVARIIESPCDWDHTQPFLFHFRSFPSYKLHYSPIWTVPITPTCPKTSHLHATVPGDTGHCMLLLSAPPGPSAPAKINSNVMVHQIPPVHLCWLLLSLFILQQARSVLHYHPRPFRSPKVRRLLDLTAHGPFTSSTEHTAHCILSAGGRWLWTSLPWRVSFWRRCPLPFHTENLPPRPTHHCHSDSGTVISDVSSHFVSVQCDPCLFS